MRKINLVFNRYEIKEIIYKENENVYNGDLGLVLFKTKFYYKVINWDNDIEEKEILFIVEVGEDENLGSVAFIKIVFKIYFKLEEHTDEPDIEDLIKLLNFYIYPRFKTIIASLTDQSRILMPYFAKPILEVDKLQ